MTEIDPGEVIFKGMHFGYTQGGEAVIFDFALANGGSGTFGWEVDAEDREIIQEIADRYEPKFKEKLAGNQGFTPNSAMPFEADKR